MVRRIVTAVALAIQLLPGAAWAQEAEQPAAGDGPAIAEPEGQAAEVVAPQGSLKAGPQESVSQTYTVKPGDTLWDLSSRFLGNPWYWPKVWSYNPEIENPHWIYPGNQIRFYAAGDELPAQVEADGANPPQDVGEVTQGSLTATEKFGEDDDVVAITSGTSMGYVAPKRSVARLDGLVTQRELDEDGRIERAYSQKEMLDNFERVYITFHKPGAVRLGERYSIFRTVGEVKHPITGSSYGYLTRIVGTLRVTAIDKTFVTGLIDRTLEPIARGDVVGPLGSFDRQLIRKENTREVKGVILMSLNPSLPVVGEHNWVFIDKGSKDGVEEGNTFTVQGRGDPLADDDPSKYPAEVNGTLLVVDVKEHASQALIIRSIIELAAGDSVVMRPASARASTP